MRMDLSAKLRMNCAFPARRGKQFTSTQQKIEQENLKGSKRNNTLQGVHGKRPNNGDRYGRRPHGLRKAPAKLFEYKKGGGGKHK